MISNSYSEETVQDNLSKIDKILYQQTILYYITTVNKDYKVFFLKISVWYDWTKNLKQPAYMK